MDIFEQLWSLPESHISVTTLDDQGQPVDPNAKLVLRETDARRDSAGNAVACLNDTPFDSLIVSLEEAVLDEPSFKTCIALMDNYTAKESKPGNEHPEKPLNDPVHGPEVDAFVDAIVTTVPIQTAKTFIETNEALTLSNDQLKQRIKVIWFEPFTNRYGAPDLHCTGFEHVFVGEDESPASNPPACSDQAGGYHSWIKYYLDQKAGKAAYYGCDYPATHRATALKWPQLATILMRWSPTVAEGGQGHPIMKIPGGFFVGTRPEFEIAVGLCGMSLYETNNYIVGGAGSGQRRMKLSGHTIDLTLHPESVTTGGATRGPRLRTLWPAYRFPVGQPDPHVVNPQPAPVPTQPVNNGPIRIKAVLPNPPGIDDNAEWVELKNMTPDTALSLDGYTLSDQEGRRQALNGPIAAGEVKRILLQRIDQNSMMLRNNGIGWVLLLEGDTRHAAVKYDDASSGQVFEYLS